MQFFALFLQFGAMDTSDSGKSTDPILSALHQPFFAELVGSKNILIAGNSLKILLISLHQAVEAVTISSVEFLFILH